MTECIVCGSLRITEVERTRTLNINGKELTIPDDRATRCEDCNELFYTGEQAKEADRKIVNARRSSEGLLNGSQIRQIRQSLGLSQVGLEKSLGIGPKTVVRWEVGTAVQSRVMDNVLRLIAFDPDNLRLLVRLRSAATDKVSFLLPGEKIKEGQLQAAVFAGVEKANISEDKVRDVIDAIVSEINSYREQRIEQFVENAQSA